ncbi:glutamate--cysteine ligase [Chitinimonas sp. BJB300]|uniref:glutamate--cysteine ligase n=1 Tax=Chitinimonas sp. BJB300 TaxID=1559339 RepID=UPI000C0E611C|nr:glutamate--cysteine ligase [Chitinimonas sp. BJB300]PHV12510.1 glutamate--cysteine ligase [Chitinimonas sp. BJB300]TSJ91140.1 glutamate--cysteine ligase [Chitinimonas sp. BJB300]
MKVPHLATALTGPLLDLERKMLTAQCEIEGWFRSQWLEHAVPFYGSVDLRNSGFKLAPVDMNLFPGGFNNLNPDFTPLCVQAVQSSLEKICPDARRLLLIPENHTRNQFYLQNVAALARILKLAGLNVRLGSLNPEIVGPTTFDLPNGASLVLEPIQRNGRRVGLPGFDPCVVLLNNDLSAGIPDILRNIDQNLLPPLHAGWFTRRKTNHFALYDGVAKEFSDLLGIDPWYINPYFGQVSQLDFQTREGEERLAAEVERVLSLTAVKYRDLGIDAAPFAIVKADAGTYGMGVMSVKSPEEVIGLNRKQRNKMAVVKEGLEVSDVIVQEGVPTFETIEDAVAEPVVYMMDRFVVGGFYRVHTERGIDENLNAPGAYFQPLAFNTPLSTPDCDGSPDCAPNRFYAYGVVARLALLAAAREIEVTEPALMAELTA